MRATQSPCQFTLKSTAIVCVIIACAASTWAQGATGLENTLDGVLSLVWGDGPPEAPSSVGPFPMLAEDSGGVVRLLLTEDQVAPLGGLLALNGRRVTVHGSWTMLVSEAPAIAVLGVESIQVAEGAAPAALSAVTGS